MEGSGRDEAIFVILGGYGELGNKKCSRINPGSSALRCGFVSVWMVTERLAVGSEAWLFLRSSLGGPYLKREESMRSQPTSIKNF